MKFVILVVCLFGVSLAQNDNIVQLAEKLGATELVKLASMAGLGPVLSGPGPFTVFGPTNDAFDKVPKPILERLLRDKKLLAELLEYHVVPGRVYSSSLSNELLAKSALKVNGVTEEVRINKYGSMFTAEGSPITVVDQNATNGVIHVINRVMYPVPLRNIPAELTEQSRRFSTLLTAVTKANLASTLSGGPFTLFAPTNEAFAKVPADVLNKLLANVTALTDVLTYHVVSGTVFSAGLSDGEMAKTVEGKDVTIKIGEGVMVNNAKVEEADLACTNGVIHVIDSVLLPPSYTSGRV